MPAAVLFDLCNTLVDGGDGARDATMDAMAADLGVDPAWFRQLWRESWRERCTGAFGDAEATVRAVALRAGARPTDAAVRLACTRRLSVARNLLWPRPSTLAALDALRAAGWRTAVVSNCTAETPQIWKTTPLAPRFEATAFSCELGVAKPDPAIYLAACSALRVAPTECLFVGDGADDELPAAAGLGMTVIRTEEFKPGAGTWPRQRINALGDLVTAIVGPGLGSLSR
jgi:putative hydrolase of the HAD superfamily